MNSSTPYLLTAMNQWICDNDMTPYITVATDRDDVIVPKEFIKDDMITLNISRDAVVDLLIDTDFVSFSARFSGESMNVIIATDAVMSIYAKENSQGMLFKTRPSKKPTLTLVK